MAGWGGGIGIKAKLRPAGAGAWPELGKKSQLGVPHSEKQVELN